MLRAALVVALACTGHAWAQPTADLRSAILAADDARVESAAHRASIATALTREDPEVRVLALRAIGRTRRTEFLPQAMAGLRHPSIDVRREAAFAVAHIGSGSPDAHAAAERALRDALSGETDVLVFSALTEQYGRLPFPTIADVDAATRALTLNIARLENGDVLPAFGQLGVARGAEGLARRAAHLKASSAEVQALLARLIEPARVAADTPRDALRARVRRLVMSGMLSLDALAPDDGGAREAFERAVRDADPQVRRLGVIGLARESTVPTDTAMTWLRDDAVLVRHAVASRVASRLPAVAEAAARDPHINVRLAAIDALGTARSCRDVCTSRLAAAEADASTWHEAAHALVALALTDAEAARPRVSHFATSAVWQVRMYAARAAQHTAQADVLATLARDSHVNVRHAALAAWRAAKLPGLTDAAVAALASDDGQLLLEAAEALGGGRARPSGEPGSADAASDGDTSVSRVRIVEALRAALARVTAQQREASRDWRMALLERIDDFDPERITTLRAYLSDFDPVIAERAAALINARRPEGAAEAGPSETLRRRPAQAAGPTRGLPVPTWGEVSALEGASVTLRLSGTRQLTIRLYPQVAPTAVARLVAQVRAGEWNGRTFHRVEPGFVVQGGSPAANEYAGADTFTRDEFSALAHVRGAVGISTRGPDTGDGQIFVNLVDNPRLDFAFTLIGSITSDLSVLDDIVEGEVVESAHLVVVAR